MDTMTIIIIVLSVFFFFASVGIAIFIIFKLPKDKVIFVRKDEGIDLFTVNLKKKTHVIIEEGVYPLSGKAVKFTSKGHRIVAFDEGNYLAPRILEHKSDKWLDSKTAWKVMNDEHIKKLMTVETPVKDIMMYIGIAGSIVAGIASVISVLIQLGIV